MYKYRKPKTLNLTSVEVVEGETIERKIERIVLNKEPITDGAPEIFTERKEGVISAYNVRTDRWEVAAEAMDKISASKMAQRDSKPKEKEIKKEDKKEGIEDKKIHGEAGKDKPV